MVDLKRLAFDKSLTQSALGYILQIPQPEVSKLINGRRDMTQAHLDLLSAHFGADVIAHYIIDDDAMDKYRKLRGKTVDATIIPAEIVEGIRDDVYNEHCPDCKAAVPYVSKDLVQSRNADIREMVLQQSPELQFKLIHELFANANYIQKVITSAMMPLFQPGDLLFVKFLPDNAKLISGAIYLLDTKTYGAEDGAMI